MILKLFSIFLFYVYRCFTFMYVCALLACLVPAEAKMALEILKLELQMFVRCCVGAGTRTWVS